jgi:hypothetical protein
MWNASWFRFLLFAALSALVWWNPMQFRTRVHLQYDGHLLRATVHGTSLEVERPGLNLHRLALRSQPSAEAVGAEHLEISAPGGRHESHDLPGRFVFHQLRWQAVGDWCLDDRMDTEEVWSKDLNLNEPFTLDLTFTGRCLQGTQIVLEGAQGLNLLWRRGFINNDVFLTEPNGSVLAKEGLSSRWQVSVRSMLDPFLKGLWLASLLALSLGVARGPKIQTIAPQPFWKLPWPVLGLILLHTGLALAIAAWVLEAMPHFQDDLCYVLRTKWLLGGHLCQPIPEHPEHFEIPFTYFKHGNWITYYPIGWPLLLAVGEFFHAAWVMPPLCSALYLIALWHLGRDIGGSRLAIMALGLTTTCLLGWILSASLMTHAASAMLLTLAVLGYWRGESRGDHRWALGGGVALGFLFAMRPLTSAAAGIALGLFALSRVHRVWRIGLWFALGVLVGSLPAWIDNALTTGSPWRFAYTDGFGYAWSWQTANDSLLTSDTTFALVWLHAFGWGWPFHNTWPLPLLGLGLALLPFASGRAQRIDYLLLLVFLSIPFAYSGIPQSGAHAFGPRYYYDAFFALFLLTGRGFAMLLEDWRAASRKTLCRIAQVVGILLLCSALGRAISRLPDYYRYNGPDRSLVRAIEQKGLTRAVVLLDPGDYLQWIQAAVLLPGSLEDDLIFAISKGNNRDLMKQYAGRPFYLWNKQGLSSYDAAPESSGRN